MTMDAGRLAARAQHWKPMLPPLSGERWPIRVSMRIDPADMALLRTGLWPIDMEDKWAAWLDEENTLRCWRSWTKRCIYECSVEPQADGSGLIDVLDALDDQERYRRAPSELEERERFERVLWLVRDQDDSPRLREIG